MQTPAACKLVVVALASIVDRYFMKYEYEKDHTAFSYRHCPGRGNGLVLFSI